MSLVDWRGDPVMPGAWLEGYKRVHPIHREPPRFPSAREDSRRALTDRRLRDELLRRRVDGTRFGTRR